SPRSGATRPCADGRPRGRSSAPRRRRGNTAGGAARALAHGIMTRPVAIRIQAVFLRRPNLRTVAADMEILVLNRSDVEQLLDLHQLLEALKDGFKALTNCEVTAPGRNEIALPEEAFLLGMPGRLRDGALTVKVVTVFESNLQRDLPSHLATIALYDPHT